MSAGGSQPERSGPPTRFEDWPSQAADAVVDAVDKVRGRTTKPALTAARAVVFSLVLAVVGLVTLVAAIIGLLRATQVILEIWVPHARAVWISYFIVGGFFTVGGLVIWRLANRKYLETLARSATLTDNDVP